MTSIENGTELKLSEYAEAALNKVALAEGFSNYKFHIEHGSSVGDGFTGVLLKVTIIENDNSKEINVVVKLPPDNVLRKHAMGAMLLFEREVFVYSLLLPEFVKFQQEQKLKPDIGFYNFPKCYFAEFDKERDDAVIIMEDLRDAGYKLISKSIPIDCEHAKLSFAALGRLHAISFAMKERSPETFEKFKALDDNTKQNLDNEMITSFMASCLDRAIGVLRDDEVKRKEKMFNLKENFVSLMKDLTSSTGAEPYAVVTHGDCWSNNFMYKYRVR